MRLIARQESHVNLLISLDAEAEFGRSVHFSTHKGPWVLSSHVWIRIRKVAAEAPDANPVHSSSVPRRAA